MKNKETIAVSACLLGHNCKYDGKNNKNSTVLELCENCTIIPVCPEMEGGLPCPRVPSEIVGDRVLTKEGEDVTKAFRDGALKCLEKTKEEKVRLAILQSCSPSCGVNEVYDGTFSGKRIPGSGVFASLLKENGIRVLDSFSIRKSTEEDFDRIMELYSEARFFMAEHGNPNQWGPTAWPPESLIHSDIKNGKSYVCLYRERIVAVFYYDFGKDIESTYRTIADGRWKGPYTYGVLHRIATDHSIKTAGRFCIEWAFSRCGNLRIDTHGDNTVMQDLLESMGFSRCGTIFVEEDDFPRFAYELFVN
ncbi:MAG: DUF523 domain-containing protein [Sphaerochaetaceae bacterium]|nr:DUF523 domain-containing protein [Sphaerochaetaceae bacterium]